MEMFNPPHPGEIIREDCIKPLGLTVTEAAKGLGVSRRSLSELLNGRKDFGGHGAKARKAGELGRGVARNRRPMISGMRSGKRRLKVTEFPIPEPA